MGNKGAEARESRLELSVSPSPWLVCHIFQALCEVDSWIRAEEGTKIHTLSPSRLCAVATTQSFRTEGMVSVLYRRLLGGGGSGRQGSTGPWTSMPKPCHTFAEAGEEP